MSKIIAPAVMSHLDGCIDFILTEAKSLGFKEPVLDKIRLACEEILVNIIHYAYPGDNGKVEINCTKSAGKKGLRIEFTDSGIPFDPLSYVSADMTGMNIEDRMIGGLGIHFVKTIMNEFFYSYEDGKNILTLVKYL